MHNKCIVYYTDSRLEKELADAARRQIKKASGGLPIVSVSQKPLDFGKNICVGMKPPNYLSLYEQLLRGVEEVDDGTIIYICEHDVFYHPTHFQFIPTNNIHIFFNLSRYYWNRNKDFFLRAIGKRALSQGIGYKEIVYEHVKEQVDARHNNIASPCRGPFNNFDSKYPNIDTRHGSNLSVFGEFDRSVKSERIYSVPYWGTPRRFKEKVGIQQKNIKTYEMLNGTFNYPPRDEMPVEVKFGRNDLPGLFKTFGFKKGAEIGVKRGVYSKILCKGIPDLELKCIDDYKPTPRYSWDEVESFFVIARHVLKKYNVTVIKKSSMQAADEDVPNESLDFVYIDADHTFDSVMRDIIVWAQKVRIGGIVSGHDYQIEDVRVAIDAYTKIHGINFFITNETSPSWFFARE